MVAEDEVAFAGVAGQAELLRTGRITAVELVETLLGRIERLNPKLNCFIDVLSQRARQEAAEADRARAEGDERPLLGVPFAVKDNLDVAGVPTRHGTGSPEPVASEDAPFVRAVRKAGMVIIGKTTLPELALWPFTEGESFGITRNPWDVSRSTGGSSGGSGAAVAAGLVPAAYASDGGGSIRIPAAACGLVGLKPQHGRLPLDPDPDHWFGLSHAGVLTRTVMDTALMYDAILGTDRYVAAADRPPSRLRIAWSLKPTTPAPVADEVRRGVETTIQLLREFGHDVVERDPPYGIVQTSFVPRYFRGVHKDLHALRDSSKTESRTRAIARLGGLWPMRTVRKARQRGDRLLERMERFFDDVDVLITPGLSRLPLRAGRYFGKGWFATFNGIARYTPYTPPWNVTGQPAMAVPAGQSADGLPVAVQLITRSDGEETLFSLGAQLESARGWAALRPPIA